METDPTTARLRAALGNVVCLGDDARNGVPISGEMRAAIIEGMRRAGVGLPGRGDDRQVVRRLLLHLPRLTREQLESSTDLRDEAQRVAADVYERYVGLPLCLRAPRPHVSDVRALRLARVPHDVASEVHAKLHYLHSSRDGHTWGLYSTGENRPDALHAMFTLSSLDVLSLKRAVARMAPPSHVLMLSRVYAFPGTLPNAISFGLARLSRMLHQTIPEIELLLTYLNPNLGFDGASYRAANWFRFAVEPKRGYLYLDGRYITEREALATHPQAVAGASRVPVRSELPLRPLEVYAYPVGRAAHARRADRAVVPVHAGPLGVMP